MFFRCETGTDVYVVNLSNHRVAFWNDILCIYDVESSDYQPRVFIKLEDIVCFELSDVEECW